MVQRRLIRLIDLDLEMRAYPPGYKQPCHSHEWDVLNIVLSGSVEESNHHGEVTAGPFNIYTRPRDIAHANFYGDSPTRVLSVLLASGWSSVRWQQPHRLVGRSSILGALLQPFRDDEVEPESVRQAVTALLKESEQALAGRCARTSDDADRACELLGAHGATVREVAAAVGRHPVALARLLRARYGVSPTELRRWQRVRKASARIGIGAALVDAALDSGFADQSHMCRDFQRVVGATPGQWRRLLSSA